MNPDILHQPPTEVIPPPREPIESLFNRQVTLGKIIQQTWQRRVIIEALQNSRRDDWGTIMQQPLAARLFSEKDVIDANIVENSALDELLKTDTADGKAHRKKIGKYLLDKADESLDLIGKITLDQLPAEIFALPNERPSLEEAQKITLSDIGKTMTMAQYFERPESSPQLITPLTETVLAAIEDKINAEIGIRVLTIPKDAIALQKAWIKQEQAAGSRVVMSPSYENAERTIRQYEQRNGRNRTVSRAIAYGPPGRGKTEFFRTINKKDGKATLVISARPFLSYEELVASPQIISREGASLADLAATYQSIDALTVTQTVINLSRQQVVAAVDEHELTKEQQMTLQKSWLKHLGFTGEFVAAISLVEDVNNLYVKENPLIMDHLETIKKTYIRHLLETASLSVVEKENKATEYLQGLIITADKLGMRVIIDESEKMYSGQEKGSESFAGLEDILTRSPGETIRVGNITHRFSDDFYIDLTMNSLDIPPHILSRFGERSFYFEEKPYDRLAIAAAELTDEDAKPIISTDAQRKIAFLLTGAWDVIDQYAQEAGVQWDLRTLQNILSTIAHSGQLRGLSVETALNAVRSDPVIEQALSLFPGLAPKITGISSLLKIMGGAVEARAETATVAVEDSEPLIGLLTGSPSDIDHGVKLYVTALSADEVTRLGWRKTKAEKPATNDQGESDNAIITIAPEAGKQVLLHSLPGNETEILHRAVIEPRINEADESLSAPIEFAAANPWGTVVLVKATDRYFAIDSFDTRNFTDKKFPQAARRVSDVISDASRICLTADGSHLVWISADGKMFCQQLGLYQKENKYYLQPKFELEILSALKPVDFTPTSDGNYALVKMQDNKGSAFVNILKLKPTLRTQKTQFMMDENLEGNSWRLETYKNIIYLFNPETNQGLRIS